MLLRAWPCKPRLRESCCWQAGGNHSGRVPPSTPSLHLGCLDAQTPRPPAVSTTRPCRLKHLTAAEPEAMRSPPCCPCPHSLMLESLVTAHACSKSPSGGLVSGIAFWMRSVPADQESCPFAEWASGMVVLLHASTGGLLHTLRPACAHAQLPLQCGEGTQRVPCRRRIGTGEDRARETAEMGLRATAPQTPPASLPAERPGAEPRPHP